MPLVLSKINRRYGALRSKPDPRDLGISRLAVSTSALPPSCDLSPFCGPIRDQGQLGSCTAFAGTAMREFLLRKYQSGDQTILSPLWLYYQERAQDGTLDAGDVGSTGRTCVQVMNKVGVCPEPDVPYNINVFENPLPPQSTVDALKYRAGAYHALNNVIDMKTCIFSNYGFIVGFIVYESFESDALALSGLMSVPQPSENQLGGHEVFFCGYDDSISCPGASFPGAFKVQNSWGTSWAKGGFFYFPYECASNPAVLMDAFIQHLGKPW